MSTKQIRLLCFVDATDSVAAQLTVSINGVQKFSGQINQTTLPPNSVYSIPIDTAEFSVITLDQDVDDLTSPPDITAVNEYEQYWTSGANEFSATITGGNMSISLMQANWSGHWSTAQWNTGTADQWASIYCASQPEWNGSVIPTRFSWPVNPTQGPVTILINDTETVVYQIGLTKYNGV